MNKVDVSVVIPLYKGEKYCPRLLKMLRENLLYEGLYEKCGVEVIFVNDYPEESVEFLYSVPLFDIVLIEHNENLGIHASRIDGIHRAKGNYIIMLDQDDLVKANWLSSQWNRIVETNSNFCVCNGWLDRFRTIWTDDAACADRVNNINTYFEVNAIVSPGQVIIRSEAIPKEWLTNILRCNGADDYMLWFMALKKENRFCVNEKYLYYHTPERTRDSIRGSKMVESVKEVGEILLSHGFLDQAEQMLFQKKVKKLECRIKGVMGEKDIYSDEMIMTNYKLKGIVEVFRKWMKLKLAGVNICQYFVERGLRDIAVYGMGNVGELLYQELLCSADVRVQYGIDRRAKDYEEKLDIYKLEDDLQQVDAVVVTINNIDAELLEILRDRLMCPVISMEEILTTLEEMQYNMKMLL